MRRLILKGDFILSIYGMQVNPLMNTFLTGIHEFQLLEIHINEGKIYQCHKDTEETFLNKKTYRYTENKTEMTLMFLSFL